MVCCCRCSHHFGRVNGRAMSMTQCKKETAIEWYAVKHMCVCLIERFPAVYILFVLLLLFFFSFPANLYQPKNCLRMLNMRSIEKEIHWNYKFCSHFWELGMKRWYRTWWHCQFFVGCTRTRFQKTLSFSRWHWCVECWAMDVCVGSKLGNQISYQLLLLQYTYTHN